MNQNRLPDRQVGEVGARLVLLLLRLDTVSGALQKLEDVLQHVAAWRGRLGAAAARQLPLHPGSKRQARPVRAGRNHRYQVGDGLRRGTRRPEHSIYLNWNILPIGQQLWEKTDGALTQIELWALFATGAVVFALVAANVWFRFIKYDDAPSVNPPHRAVARSQGWLRAARLSISPRAERNRLRRGQQRSDRMAVGGGAIRPRQAERAAIRTIHFARRRDIGAIRTLPKRDGAMDQRPAHAGAQRVFQHSQSFLAEQFPRRSLPITEGWSRAAHRIELDDPPARHNHCTGAQPHRTGIENLTQTGSFYEKIIVLTAVMVLIGSGAAAAIKALAPSVSTAMHPTVSIEEIHRQLDVTSLPILEVKDPI